MQITIKTNVEDFPHNVMKAALAKYVEKFHNLESVDEEGLEDIGKDINKFLNRLVKTVVTPTIIYSTADDKVDIEFVLEHALR